MKIIFIDILITTCLISFVSSENYSSASASSPSSPSSSSPPLISALISSSEPSSTVNNQQKYYNSHSSLLPILNPNSANKFNSLPSNFPRFLKRFELDLPRINNVQNHLLGSSLTSHNQYRTNPKPLELPLPKLLSIDLSILDKPLALPVGYYGDFDDLSFPRDSRSNEIDDNLNLNPNHNQENGNIKNLAINANTDTNSKSTGKSTTKEINYNSNDKSNYILPTNNGEMDYNGYYFDFNDDIPNEVPMDPVYFDDEQIDHSVMVNDQVNSEQEVDYQPIFDHLPDHLSTGNDALSDYLTEIRSTNNHQFPYQHQHQHHHKHNHLQEVKQHQIVLPSSSNQPLKSSSPYFVESVYQLAKPEPPKAISIVDLFKHFNHESSSNPINPKIPNWFHIGQPDLLMNTLQGSLLLPVKSETKPNQSNNQNLNQHLNQNYNQHPILFENQQQSYGAASRKGPTHLILDNSILNNQYHNVHHHQHQLPSSFSIQSLADVNHNKNDNNENNVNDKSVQTLSNLAQLNHQVNRDLVNIKPIK